MNGIFISHSTKNKKLVEQVMELLQLGMGIGRNHIFCTSLYDAPWNWELPGRRYRAYA